MGARGHISAKNLKFTSIVSEKELTDLIIDAGYINKFSLGEESQVFCNSRAIAEYFLGPNKRLEKAHIFRPLTDLVYSRCRISAGKLIRLPGVHFVPRS